MPWQDRILESAYVSPSGARFVFLYENVSKSIDKKTTGFDFPDANGTYIQDLGNTGFRYNLRLIFSGANYDTISNEFESALLEKGTGTLEHPIYGVKNVVPFGTIRRRDDLKTAANQAIFEIVFWETIDLIYPTSQADPASEVVETIEEYNDKTAIELEEELETDTAFKRVTLANKLEGLLKEADSTLSKIAETQENVLKQFNNIKDSITRGIDTLINDPIALARQTAQMIQAPGRALTSISARLDGYKNLIGSLIFGENSIATGQSDFDSNEFYAKNLYASTYVTGSIISAVNNQFVTKPQAIEAAESILNQFSDVANWRDENFEALDRVDTGASYQKLQESVSIVAGFLVDISFSLKQERSIILDRDRTIIDLEAELYGTVDENLDFLINSNDLAGHEFLELKKGREIVYFV